MIRETVEELFVLQVTAEQAQYLRTRVGFVIQEVGESTDGAWNVSIVSDSRKGLPPARLRSPLVRFAKAMEEKMRGKDKARGPRGWREAGNASLLRQVDERNQRLKNQMSNFDFDGVKDALIDLANLSMMAFDKLTGGES